jgi:uncharacterized membrane protein YeaQ/YmgE (transglycosylase-associated protein family)
MSILMWILLGLVAGWFASLVMKTEAYQGTLTDIILGVVGAVVGGLLMNLLGQPGVAGLNLYSLAVAIMGAVVLIWFGRILNAAE